MRLAVAIGLVLVMGPARSTPIVLWSDDLHDRYEEAPAELREATRWLGLFITKGKPGAGQESRLSAADVRVVKDRRGGDGWTIETMPPDATILVSGVANLRPGPALTS